MFFRITLGVLVVALSLPAQSAAGSVAPAIAVMGEQVQMTVVASQDSGIAFLDGCVIKEVRAGSPMGATVYSPAACPDIYFEVQMGQTTSGLWNQLNDAGLQVSAGEYYLRTEYRNLASNSMESLWLQVVIAGIEPLVQLAQINEATPGVDVAFALSAPEYKNGVYIAAISASISVGHSIAPGLRLALNMDAFFAMSFDEPNPNFFSNFSGSLNHAGETAEIVISLPDLPELAHRGFHVQALAIDPNGRDGVKFSNVASVVIRG